MKVSVLIPTFNSQHTITKTIESVLNQSVKPAEILILDDGSTDSTLAVLDTYKEQVIVLKKIRRGVAAARNELCLRAVGDLIAFLDHDDIWHPEYLESQIKLCEKYPDAVALFTGHFNFRGHDIFSWPSHAVSSEWREELITPVSFLKRYNFCPGIFASMSYCCMPRAAIKRMGPEPFVAAVSGVDDFCLCNRMPLFGPVAYTARPLVAYRITQGAQSANRLKGIGLSVRAFELLGGQYSQQGDRRLARAFSMAHASKKRSYAKILMGVGRRTEAREQLFGALLVKSTFLSLVKTATLLGWVQLPGVFHPTWPSWDRP